MRGDNQRVPGLSADFFYATVSLPGKLTIPLRALLLLSSVLWILLAVVNAADFSGQVVRVLDGDTI